jgi:hypothetical protein
MKDMMSTDEMGALLGSSPQRVREMTRAGVLVKSGDDGRSYPVEENVRRAFAHLRTGAAGRGGKAATGVATERAGLLVVQRRRAEFEFEREFKKWMPIAEFDRYLKTYTLWLRNQVLAIPSRLLGVDREVVIQVKDEVERILTDIANGEYDPPELKEARRLKGEGEHNGRDG